MTTFPGNVREGIQSVKAFISQLMQCFQFMISGTLHQDVVRSSHASVESQLMVMIFAEPMKYVNCCSQHSSKSRSCPVYKQEVTVQKVLP